MKLTKIMMERVFYGFVLSVEVIILYKLAAHGFLWLTIIPIIGGFIAAIFEEDTLLPFKDNWKYWLINKFAWFIQGVLAFLLIIGAIFIIYSAVYPGHSTAIKHKKEFISLENKVHHILNIKSANKKDVAFIYGLYLQKSVNTDKDIINCYNKYHKISYTTECLKGIKN